MFLVISGLLVFLSVTPVNLVEFSSVLHIDLSSFNIRMIDRQYW